jgi:quercetin dioxygenase-like cupin family protein
VHERLSTVAFAGHVDYGRHPEREAHRFDCRSNIGRLIIGDARKSRTPGGKSTIMDIQRIGSIASTTGPSDWFTGQVNIDPLFDRVEPARVSGAKVTFEPGARTAWHTHPLGQTLIVISGCGWVQKVGEPVEEIHVGDVVIIAPGEKHWHGASATTAMTHIAIQEKLNGKAVDWLEHVSDAEYKR